MAAGVSHEIRNAFTTLMWHVEVLEEELQDLIPAGDSELENALSEIKMQLQRLEHREWSSET